MEQIMVSISCNTYNHEKYIADPLENQNFSSIKVIYPFLPPCFFFMLCGDLMSSLAYTLAYVLMFWFKISRWHVKVNQS